MKYSRNKINTAGKLLLAGPEIGFAFTDANLVVDDWRKLHMVPLEELVGVVTKAEFVQSLQDFNNTCKAKHYI